MAAGTKTIIRYRKPKVKRRRSNGVKVPVALVAGFFPLLTEGIKGFNAEGLTGMMKQTTYAMTGYHIDSNSWEFSRMKSGLFPILGGMVVHWVAKTIGINRALGRAGVPLLRV